MKKTVDNKTSNLSEEIISPQRVNIHMAPKLQSTDAANTPAPVSLESTLPEYESLLDALDAAPLTLGPAASKNNDIESKEQLQVGKLEVILEASKEESRTTRSPSPEVLTTEVSAAVKKSHCCNLL